MTWAQRWSVSMICLVWNFKVPSRRKVSIEREPLRKLERNTQSWNVAALFDFKCRLNINFCKKKKKSSSSSSRRPFSSHSLRPTDCWLAFHTKLVGGKNASDDPICVRKKKSSKQLPCRQHQQQLNTGWVVAQWELFLSFQRHQMFGASESPGWLNMIKIN